MKIKTQLLSSNKKHGIRVRNFVTMRLYYIEFSATFDH
jgi:hypothetical protein